MKHILFVSTSFPDKTFQKGQEAAGGFVADFASALAQYAQVTVIAPSDRNSIDYTDYLTIYRFAVPSLPLSLLRPQNPAHWFKILQTLCAGQKAVEQVAKNENPDHIFALWALPSGYWARKTSIPYSIWALGSDIWTLGRIPIIKQYLRNVIRNSQNRFADGFLLADDVKAISGLDCQFLPSSRNLVSKGKKSLSTHPPYRLAFLGRWHSNKGIDLLLDSLQLLQKEDWEKIEEVQICGGGPLKYVVEKAVKQMKSKHLPVSLHGYLNKEEAIELLTWADYLLLPSRIESIPVIFSDALQCNCPVIGSPVGDVPRLISDYQVGVLAKETSTNAFKNAIKSALKKPPAMFTNGLKQARHLFNIDEAAGRFLKTL